METKIDADIIVVGSCNMDLITYVDRLPKAGETIQGNKFESGFGGKGANQCVAASKLGGKACMVSKVGTDEYGTQYIENFKNLGINTIHVLRTSESTTGVAPIMVADDGMNSIVIIPGANMLLTPDEVQAAFIAIKKPKVMVCQLEINRQTTLSALKIAKDNGVITIFNPAPAPEQEPLSSDFYKYSDVICPNETEAFLMTGINVNDVESGKLAAKKLKDKYNANTVVITMGKLGCVFTKENGDCEHVDIPRVEKVVDTTGAGDSFAGSLAYYHAYYPHLCLKEKIKRSCQIASYSVQRKGSQKSYAYKKDLPAELFQWSLIIKVAFWKPVRFYTDSKIIVNFINSLTVF